jgi:thiazole synthase
MVTVAVNRVPLYGKSESFLDHLDPAMQILPNTAGCYDADHAIRTARLAREALETDWIKLEVIGDQVTLLPDNEQTLEAARVLIKEAFIVLPYFTDDLIMARKLLDAGCPAVMPLAAPIGSGMGVQSPSNLRIMREQLPDATIIVDAGVGVPSDAAVAMELGADAILMNTAIAEAGDAALMAQAMKLAVEAGRMAYRSGRMPKRLYASASSPIAGAIK